jgi:hypothetical protein
MNIEDFKKQLDNHDWYYQMSEDRDVYRQGKYKHDKLVELSETNPEFKKLFREYAERKYAIFS